MVNRVYTFFVGCRLPAAGRPVAGRWPCGCRPVACRLPAAGRLVAGRPAAGRCRPVPGRIRLYMHGRCARLPAGAGAGRPVPEPAGAGGRPVPAVSGRASMEGVPAGRSVPVAGRCRWPAGSGGRPVPAGAGGAGRCQAVYVYIGQVHPVAGLPSGAGGRKRCAAWPVPVASRCRLGNLSTDRKLPNKGR